MKINRPHSCGLIAVVLSTIFLVLAAGLLSAEQSGLFTYRILADDTIEISSYPSTASGPVSIPHQIEGKQVVAIGDFAFYKCAQITSVDIPPCLDRIGFGAFRECSQLETLNIPSGVRYIGGQAFAFCFALSGEIVIPSRITTIYREVFLDCYNIKHIFSNIFFIDTSGYKDSTI